MMNIYRQILTKYWGYSEFRSMQEDIILSVAENKKDTLGLLPTGGGKSVLFQVPALASDGMCLVITPLIALMKDQVENLLVRKISAAAIYSGMSYHEIDITLNNAVYGAYKFLYLSPERLKTEIFIQRLPEMKINLIAIDEAHCISQWGYDFRPAYLNIADIRYLKPEVPILALTATATEKVAKDIQEKLSFKEQNVFRKSFERKNLIYIVREVEDKYKYLIKILDRQKGSGIVYVRNRKLTVEIAKFLTENNISADFYHAGVDAKLKDIKQEKWKQDKIRIIVSTNAFGMGIDKPDVRVVVHIDLPDSPEAYFQEAGRGGRDGKLSYAILLYNKKDIINANKRTITNFPEREKIKDIYEAICNYSQIETGEGKGSIKTFNLREFCTKFKFEFNTAYNSLLYLKNEGYIDFTEEVYNRSKVYFLMNRDELYKFQVANSVFDIFLKLILRTYPGVFSKYVTIDEEELAKKTNSTKEIVIKYLDGLRKLKVLNYVPFTNKPFIVFTTERLSKDNLIISKPKYDEKKLRYTERAEAMINYAESRTKCRSKILLAYFGEFNTERCGKCDICNHRNELNLSSYEFDIILESIKKTLQEQDCDIESVIKASKSDETKTIKVMRWLLEQKKIDKIDENRFRWNK